MEFHGVDLDFLVERYGIPLLKADRTSIEHLDDTLLRQGARRLEAPGLFEGLERADMREAIWVMHDGVHVYGALHMRMTPPQVFMEAEPTLAKLFGTLEKVAESTKGMLPSQEVRSAILQARSEGSISLTTVEASSVELAGYTTFTKLLIGVGLLGEDQGHRSVSWPELCAILEAKGARVLIPALEAINAGGGRSGVLEHLWETPVGLIYAHHYPRAVTPALALVEPSRQGLLQQLQRLWVASGGVVPGERVLAALREK